MSKGTENNKTVLSNWAPGLELLSVSDCGFESSVSSQTPHGEVLAAAVFVWPIGSSQPHLCYE